MKVLHLNSYYIDNHLYSQLYKVLNTDIDQLVYIPIKTDRDPENLITLDRAEFVFEKIIEQNHKYNYFGKIKKILNSIQSKGLVKNIDFVHAHNLFTDGALAYKLKKRFNVSYIVAVRTTDIGLQYRLMWHRRPLIHRVLKNADRVIFISNTYRDKLFAMMPKTLVLKIAHKVQVIPNGIDDMWLNNLRKPIGKSLGPTVRLLYVGQILKRKNIVQLIEAVRRLNEAGDYKFTLTIIGPESKAEPSYYNAFIELIKPFSWVEYKGRMSAGESLLQAYRDCDIFVMPSKNELFGLVYIEALSQGKPLLYAKGEGIDGFLRDYHVGEAVNPDSSEDIAAGINKIINGYKNYTDFDEVVLPFNWNSIAKTYKNLYLKDE